MPAISHKIGPAPPAIKLGRPYKNTGVGRLQNGMSRCGWTAAEIPSKLRPTESGNFPGQHKFL
eukprot:scaffold126422_cov10-Tisochrysis_lutea.AAC.1